MNKSERILNSFRNFMIIISIILTIPSVTIILLICYEDRNNLDRNQKKQAILDYYQDTEALLDSLCIYENDSIFNTNVGNRYLESKYKFDSLIIKDK